MPLLEAVTALLLPIRCSRRIIIVTSVVIHAAQTLMRILQAMLRWQKPSLFLCCNAGEQIQYSTTSNSKSKLFLAPPTTYAPYTGQTATITLPRTIYGGTVDAVTGDAKSEYLKYTVNGTEEFVFNDRADGTQYFSATILQIPNVNDIEESIKTELCSHYPIANPYMVKTACAWLLNQKVNYLRISDPRFSTVEEFKSYLAAQYAAGTPVQVCYKLASPVPITATGAQPIPALSGVNTLMTDADSVTVTGRADPIKRIIDLEDAVASMTNT